MKLNRKILMGFIICLLIFPLLYFTADRIPVIGTGTDSLSPGSASVILAHMESTILIQRLTNGKNCTILDIEIPKKRSQSDNIHIRVGTGSNSLLDDAHAFNPPRGRRMINFAPAPGRDSTAISPS